ncbi:hypothetical protein LTR48_005610 [Friedmanniomyces endolithicus]|uniref:AA9 family lytic polysaccharide monooxygenase n=1 Tax=Rachicladosporium monterosium TaxID=1507873 RepID=A0ABR0LF20_9PEZI|nr:hypothetical protein LTR48_005610 [Friedmanniomyces endolithicus]KAK5147797.1 hypothetical protein LTR32_000816 [Rachicladosporium monterosium]
MAYMKKVADATQNPSAGPGDGWFKIAEAGLISSTQWAMDKLISDGDIQTVEIPACLASGDYLLRFEVIALHSASQASEAQFYMECAQIRVTGAASPQTPTSYEILGIYSATDKGILVNIYNDQGQPYPNSYTIPGMHLRLQFGKDQSNSQNFVVDMLLGPSVFSCSADTGDVATVAAPAKSATTLKTVTSIAKATTSTKPTTLHFIAKPTTSTKPTTSPSTSNCVANYQ